MAESQDKRGAGEVHGAADTSPRRVLDIASGYEPALILEAAVRLNVFDVLDERPATLAEVVRRTNTSPRGMRALLNALVGLDLLDKYGDQYVLTEESAAYLVTRSPAYQGYMCKHVSRHLLPRWTHLTDVVRTGKPAGVVNEQADGGAYFREFVEDIFPMSYEAAQALAVHLGVPRAAGPVYVLDLAAGSGVWSVALAEASPRVTATAVDWPAVVPVTRRVAERHGVADQFRFVEGDLLDADWGTAPSGGGYDVATLGHILHSEGEARSRRLLRKTFDAMAPGGTVVVAEFVADDDRTGPPGALIFAVTMLVNTDEGDTFTFAEMAGWLREAGFVDPREVDVPGPAPLILATKPR
jgi:SAM-dependent methyltransferase